jgi:hypothetical protein
MAKVGYTNQQWNIIDIITLHNTLRRSMRLLHWKHISMSNALISPSKIGPPFDANYAIIVTNTRTT